MPEEDNVNTKKWLVRLLILLVAGTGCLFPETAGVTLKEQWLDIHQKDFNLRVLFENREEITLLIFRAVDCAPCVQSALKKMVSDGEAVAVVGYIYESELDMLRERQPGIKVILRDKNYELYRQLKLKRPTPLILRVNKDLQVVEIIDTMT